MSEVLMCDGCSQPIKPFHDKERLHLVHPDRPYAVGTPWDFHSTECLAEWAGQRTTVCGEAEAPPTPF